MTLIQISAFVISGLFAGVLAGLLGIGGGTVLVPILVALGYSPIQAVATSSLAIIITSLSGSLQNWRMGYLDFKRVLLLGGPAVVTAQIGVLVATGLPQALLLAAFALLLALNIYLVGFRQRLTKQSTDDGDGDGHGNEAKINPGVARVLTGGIAGFLAGLLGIGGGVIMVPLQMLLLGETIKRAIQTSLGVIVLTAIASTLGHALQGNVIWLGGLILGCGGLVGVQFSTRALPKLPDRVVALLFRTLLTFLIAYTLWQAWQQTTIAK